MPGASGGVLSPAATWAFCPSLWSPDSEPLSGSVSGAPVAVRGALETGPALSGSLSPSQNGWSSAVGSVLLAAPTFGPNPEGPGRGGDEELEVEVAGLPKVSDHKNQKRLEKNQKQPKQ